MTRLVYVNYLRDKDFNFEEEYKKIFNSSFQLTLTKKEKRNSKVCTRKLVRNEFKYNKKNIFTDKENKSLLEIFTKFNEKKIDEFDVIFENKKLEDILISDTSEILNLISKNGNKSNLKKLKYFFNYDKFQDEITKFFKNNFDFRTCFYHN